MTLHDHNLISAGHSAGEVESWRPHQQKIQRGTCRITINNYKPNFYHRKIINHIKNTNIHFLRQHLMPLNLMSHLHLHELTASDCVLKQDHPIPLVSVVRCRGRGQLNRKYCLYWSNVSGGHSWPAHCTGHVWSLYTLQRTRGSYNQSLKSCNISSSQSDAASVPPTTTALYQGQFIIICLQLILSGHRTDSRLQVY